MSATRGDSLVGSPRRPPRGERHGFSRPTSKPCLPQQPGYNRCEGGDERVNTVFETLADGEANVGSGERRVRPTRQVGIDRAPLGATGGPDIPCTQPDVEVRSRRAEYDELIDPDTDVVQ